MATSGRLQFGSLDDIFLTVYATNVSTGAGLSGLTNVSIAIVRPDGTLFTPSISVLSEVNASVVPGVYEITLPNADFSVLGSNGYGVFQYAINPNSASAAKMSAGSFERLSSVTTTSSAPATRYGTVDRVRALLPGTTASTSLIEGFLDDATELIERVTGDIFRPVSLVLEINGTGRRNLYHVRSGVLGTNLRSLSISEILRRSNYTDDWTTSGVIVPADYYQPKGHYLRLMVEDISEGKWLWGHRNYRISGSFGCAETPRAIHEAASILAADMVSPGFWRSQFARREDWKDYEYEMALRSDTGLSAQAFMTGVRPADNKIAHYMNKVPRISLP